MSDSSDDPLRGLVHDWPYAREFVLDTMDPVLIQRHGELLLSRAVNIGRIVAFVGAGVSMSYGRISWRELVRELLESAQRAYRKSKTDYKVKHPRINIIYDTLQALKPNPGADEDGAWRDMPPARLLILFQIADELGEAIHRVKSHNTRDLNPVRRKARQLVYDDAGHARRLFESSYKNRSNAEKKSGDAVINDLMGYLDDRPLSRDLSNSQPRYEPIFDWAKLDDIIEGIPPKLEFLVRLCKEFRNYRGAQVASLNPTHRFIVAAALASTTGYESDERFRGWVSDRKSKEAEADRRSKEVEASSQLPATGDEPRRFRGETVDQERDPLLLLVNRLGVRRFITTNYDLDIERMMLDRGYRLRLSGHDDVSGHNFIAESVNTMEARARDFVFNEQRAAHLIDFAVQDGRFALDVVHLHGRATDGDDIVATEADYQRLYLRDDSGRGRGRDLLDGAINLAFRGNALLFVGNGMGEDDLLRPLRHFMSEGPSGRESDAIALLPDLRGAQSRLEEKATLLRRYGVYTIHFGRGSLDRGDRKEEFLLSGLIKLIRFLARQIIEIRSRKVPAKGVDEAIKELLDSVQGELRKGEVSKDETTGANGEAATQKTGAREDEHKEAGVSRRLVVICDEPGLKTIKVESVYEIEGRPPSLINCELEAINYLLDFCIRAACGNPDEYFPESRAAQIIAENTEDSIVAGFLSATISRLQETWSDWRKEWFGDIAPRLPASPSKGWGNGKASPLLAEGAKIDRRRAIDLPPDYNFQPPARAANDKGDATPDNSTSEDNEPPDGRFRIHTSQTLARACYSLSRHVLVSREGRNSAMLATGRRVFVLAGARGIGKGHFFSALTEDKGLLKFLEATWREKWRTPKYSAAFAFNFSFSVELGSGFDRLVRFLGETIENIYCEDQAARKEFNKLYEQIAGKESSPATPASPHSGHRIGLLDFLFKVIAGKIEDLPEISNRFVLLFNATHLLFDEQGIAKSADVTRIMKVLLDEEHADAGIDVIFITDERGIPAEFRDYESDRFSKTKEILILKEEPPRKWALEIVHSPSDHLRSDAEDEAVITRLNLRRSIPAPRGSRTSENVAIFLRLQPAMLAVVATAAFPRTLAAIVCVARDKEPRLFPDQLNDLGRDAQIILKDQAKRNEISEGVVDRYEYVKEIATLGRAKPLEKSDSDLEKIDREFGTFFKAFGGNRFAITVAFAVADEELVVETNTKDALGRTLIRIRDEVSGIDDPSREDSIVRAAIAIHRRRGIRQAAFPDILKKLIESLGWTAQKHQPARLFHRLSEICEELLVVLSMIGYPIEQDCLVALKFRAWTGWSTDFGNDVTPGARKAVVAAALQILVQRCLIFRFEPQEQKKKPERLEPKPCKILPEQEGTERFGVHRHIQRHIFRQLKQPFVEHAEIESYMPTLYASQPNDLPYPTISAQSRIREILASLSRYPSYSRLHESRNDQNEHTELQSRMLRAAYGAIRTVYGVGVVARFNEFGDSNVPPAVGYFEEHRQQVRWLLKRGKEIEQLLRTGVKNELDEFSKTFGAGAKAHEKEIREEEKFLNDKLERNLPFYSGDIAWLYNECGVLCLVQGRLNDASKLFSEAMRALLPIERRGTPAALTASVRLNRALVDIELGNLPKAGTALRDIVSQQDEHRAVRWIAFGYLGLIEHIRGNLDEARSRYDSAIKALTAMKRNRAASIFSRHCADLCRNLKGEDNLKLAEQIADNAVNLAAAGSHADVLQQARLSRLRIQADRHGSALFARLRKELEGIEAYAKVMGMPRLEVETAHVDAYFRCQLGDLTMAMKSITRSLAIANDCDLVLRKISGTLLAAEISKGLGMLDGARTLAETAKVMATTAEFSAAQDKAQTILASL
ncbi:SIR2 family protein [Bradyrhizobium sp. S69]|uniref:SIR2 family protein n=1 Tax=Bradyrhizobium sp. S69 TaxID=1641856 RepID=UPI00131B851B|nr:SIR2 family protein [Bradyrhizobium sp. S69]